MITRDWSHCEMWVTSRGLDVLPHDRDAIQTSVWFNMWTRRFRPYRELRDGDVVFFYDPPSRRVIWRTVATKVQRTEYTSKAAAARWLAGSFGGPVGSFTSSPYFQQAPPAGYLLAWTNDQVDSVDLHKPEVRRFPQLGWLAVDDLPADERAQWGLDTASRTTAAEFHLRPGETIRRTQLHDRYGGRRYGGISPSSQTPNVFLFTDPATGRQHGYWDGWVNDELFHYTGEGQHGDQRLEQGNIAIARHQTTGRALRLFFGTGGIVRYLGELTVDPTEPLYRDDAPETGNGPVREVLVFRLRPVGEVHRLPRDELFLSRGPLVTEVPIEQQHTERAMVNPRSEPHEAERREHRLVLAYKAYMEARGSRMCALRFQPAGELKPLFCDVYDASRGNLLEAKGSTAREAIRMAIGQLADYVRFVGSTPRLAVLLPTRPRADLEELLRTQSIAAVWQDNDRNFTDNSDGQFT